MAFFQALRTIFFGPRVSEPVEKFGPAIFRQSRRLWVVNGGGGSAEILEIEALTNPYYDFARCGFSFALSPRQADVLLVAGPITRNLATAVRTTYEAMPKPCTVVAVGDGACAGSSSWQGSYAIIGPAEAIIPVHLRIPGRPPTPAKILQGLLVGLQG